MEDATQKYAALINGLQSTDDNLLACVLKLGHCSLHREEFPCRILLTGAHLCGVPQHWCCAQDRKPSGPLSVIGPSFYTHNTHVITGLFSPCIDSMLIYIICSCLWEGTPATIRYYRQQQYRHWFKFALRKDLSTGSTSDRHIFVFHFCAPETILTNDSSLRTPLEKNGSVKKNVPKCHRYH